VTSRRVLRLAGAGCGKTHMLTDRLVHLLVRERVDPSRVLAITFTREAAAQMFSRLVERLVAIAEGNLADGASQRAAEVLDRLDPGNVCTIDALAHRLVTSATTRLPVGRPVTILSSDEQEALAAACLRVCLDSLSRDFEQLPWLLAMMGLTETDLLELANAAVSDWVDFFEMKLQAEGILLSTKYRAPDPDPMLRSAARASKVEAGRSTGRDLLQASGEVEAIVDLFRSQLSRSSPEMVQESGELTDAILRTLAHGLLKVAAETAIHRFEGGELTFRELTALARLAIPEAIETGGLNPEHILIDEFQDTDVPHVSLVAALASACGAAVEAVGDINQSIYSFRGASPLATRELLGLEVESEPGSFANRRSSEHVLSFVNAVCAELYATFGRGETYRALCSIPGTAATQVPVPAVALGPEITACPDAGSSSTVADRRKAEATWAARVVEGLLQRGVPPASIAILMPAPKLAGDYLKTELATKGIACSLVTQEHSPNRYLSSCLAILRAASCPNEPWAQLAAALECCPPETEGNALSRWSGASSDVRTGQADSWLDWLSGLVESCAVLTPSAALTLALETSLALFPATSDQLLQELRSAERVLMRLRRDLLEARLSGLPEVVRRLETELELSARESSPTASSQDMVRVFSIHAAKGLEFDVVILMGLERSAPRAAKRLYLRPESGTLEIHVRKALRTSGASDIEKSFEEARAFEEPNLIYVALTRARKALFIAVPQGKPSSDESDSEFLDSLRASLEMARGLKAVGSTEQVIEAVADALRAFKPLPQDVLASNRPSGNEAALGTRPPTAPPKALLTMDEFVEGLAATWEFEPDILTRYLILRRALKGCVSSWALALTERAPLLPQISLRVAMSRFRLSEEEGRWLSSALSAVSEWLAREFNDRMPLAALAFTAAGDNWQAAGAIDLFDAHGGIAIQVLPEPCASERDEGYRDLANRVAAIEAAIVSRSTLALSRKVPDSVTVMLAGPGGVRDLAVRAVEIPRRIRLSSKPHLVLYPE
jgi:superfamily I DNA/RNA helicase